MTTNLPDLTMHPINIMLVVLVVIILFICFYAFVTGIPYSYHLHRRIKERIKQSVDVEIPE